MNTLKLSHHANQRSIERNIDKNLIYLVQLMGCEYHDHNGDIFYELKNRKFRNKISKSLRKMADKLERKDGLFVVEDTDEGIIKTTGHVWKHHKRH